MSLIIQDESCTKIRGILGYDQQNNQLYQQQLYWVEIKETTSSITDIQGKEHLTAL